MTFQYFQGQYRGTFSEYAITAQEVLIFPKRLVKSFFHIKLKK